MRSAICVSLVFRRIVAVRAMMSLASAIQKPQNSLQLFLRSDRDAREPRPKVFAALANQNSMAREVAKKGWSGAAEIGQQKITRAWKHAHVAPSQFVCEPFPQPLRVADVALN